MAIKLELIPTSQRPVLERMFQLYLHDMSEFLGWSVGADGMFALPDGLLPPYWDNTDHWPYFAYSDDNLIGFSLVRVAPNAKGTLDMGQFFVTRAFQGKGLGKELFRQTVAAHPGKWQVRVLVQNIAAQAFWRVTIEDIARSTVQVSDEPYGEHEMTYYRFEAG
ncbi:GNAT family N-acetyltransferase [Aliiroseovarius sp. 2305UL8-7]|uniref:GNAT family N-acetyltransferase n=1 Tax=Aliiroseovarius conchicola TaxID=3121637 RepID=UPI0035292D34